MTWKEAKQEIKKKIKVGTGVNTVKSHFRIVICVCDDGYTIPKGLGRYMFVTWDMLEKCWNGMVANRGKYDRKEFGKHYPKHPGCYVQTIHMIFKKAGLT